MTNARVGHLKNTQRMLCGGASGADVCCGFPWREREYAGCDVPIVAWVASTPYSTTGYLFALLHYSWFWSTTPGQHPSLVCIYVCGMWIVMLCCIASIPNVSATSPINSHIFYFKSLFFFVAISTRPKIYNLLLFAPSDK